MSEAVLDPTAPIDQILATAARLLVPFARMYLGPAVGQIDRAAVNDPGGSDSRVLHYAFSKLVLEAGTLPAPSTAYAPHSAKFAIDERGFAPALDLPFVLAAARAAAMWAGAGPAPANADTAATTATPAQPPSAPPSARELRMAARARAYSPAATTTASSAVAYTPARASGGCGCRGAATLAAAPRAYPATRATTATTVSSVARKTARTPGCSDPKPRCDCGGTCGGTGCGCSGTQSCTDCIPRGPSAGDLCGCTCGTCTPPPDTCTPWTPSCQTRNRLRACLKDILCDLLKCIEDALCVDAIFDPKAAAQARLNLNRCLVDLICKLFRCIREAICPPPCPSKLSCPPPVDCLPCGYAVEEAP